MPSSLATQLPRISQALFACVVAVVTFSLLAVSPAFATDLTFTSSSDWNAGTKTNVDTSVREGDLSIQADGNWGARSWRTPDFTINPGAAFAIDGNNIYTNKGNGDILFWKYSADTNSWTELARLPKGAYYGASFEYLDGYIYAIFGGYQRAFARYNISTNTWQELSSVPDIVFSGGALGTDGTDIYALRGNSSQDFFKYDVSAGTWVQLSGAPATIGAGADLVYSGGYFYTPRGNNTNTMYRFQVSNNTWTTMTNIPATVADIVTAGFDGSKIYLPRQNNTQTVYVYNIEGNSWSTITDLPATARYGGVVYNSEDGYLYIFRGNGSYTLWKYDLNTNTYLGVADPPATLTTGSDMVYYGGDMYVPRGASTTTFYGYDVATNVWTTLTAAPQVFADDTKGVAADSYLYFFRASNTANFYRYSPAGNSWATMTDAPAAVRFGGALAYPGSGDYIYATRGATTLSFWRYSISGNSWSDVAVADLPTDAESSYGSRLVSDGTDMYYNAGIGLKRLYKYTVATDTWSELAALPFAPFYGTDMVYDSGKIIALAGWYGTEVWEYTIAANTWRKLPNLPGYYAYDLGAYLGASIEVDGNGGYMVSRGNGTLDILSYTPGSDEYESSGTWVSEAQDLGYVASWSGLSSSSTNLDDSSILFETRTSADGSSWSSWSSVSGGTISSAANRYLQVRATLVPSTGNAATPTLHSITISYAGDTTAPTNPTSTTGLSQEVSGTALTSGESYTYTNPYFAWTGQADGQTSVAGFYVYFGTNASADPEAVGDYQTTANYTVTAPLSTGTYYLRIKTKDTKGNISAAATLFTYGYSGVSPAQSLTVTDSADFTGTASSVNTTGDKIKLASKSNGFWKEETLSTTPASMQYGARQMAYVSDSSTLYAFRGSNATTFYSYAIGSDSWSTLAAAPANVRMGGGVVEGPEGYLYGLRGNNTTAFWRYDIDANTWSDGDAADAPLTIYYGGAMAYDGSQYIYVLRGNNDDAFWRYNTTDDEWETLASVDFGATIDAINNYVYYGGDLAIDTENELIYAIQGNLRDGFSVYDMNTNSWEVLPDVPQLGYLGATIEYSADTGEVFYIPGTATDAMYKYSVAEQTWTQVSKGPSTFYYGAGMRIIDNDMYVIRGNNSTSFYKYNIAKDSWLVPTRGLWAREYLGTNYLTPSTGSDILKGDGNNFYLARGNYADDFLRWNESTGETTRLAKLPVGAIGGASMVYDSTNNVIYMTGGAYLQKFFKYDIATDTWSEESSDPYPANVDNGSSMVYDGSRYIYLTRGAGQTSLYRFDTQGSSGAKWTTLANAPGGFSNGAELAILDGYIYTLRATNVANNPFYRYDIANNTWSDPAVADLNIDVYNDSFLANPGNGELYAIRGENDNDFYKYSIAGNAWTTLPNAPARVTSGGGGESNGTNKIYMMTGPATNAFNDGLYTYVVSTENSAFEESGSYTTQTHDLTTVYKWANLQVSYTSATNTSLSIQTRSSSDNSTWSSWTAVAQEKQVDDVYYYQIKSPAARYLEIKFSLTSSDGVYSGVIDDYTVNYYRDTTAPENPENAGLSAYSTNAPGSAIVSGAWYGYSAPYFDWPDAEATNGATDTAGGSGVSGYYVYFGTSSSADPESDGTLQSASSYTASGLVNGSTYYLRIKTRDDAGNISADTWAPFTYKFDGEAPSAPTGVTADPSGYTSTDSFDFTWEVATASGATITEYCYKTGASTGDYATDQCTAATTVSDIPSHKVGANTFYVRAKDAAGNYSSYATAPYYYVDSGNAPAPPTNLQVTPTSNTQNSFAFSWDAPATGTYYGSVSNLSYYYSINALPTAQSTTATSLKSLVAGAFATLPGDNVFYIVTKDEAGNINYSNYASVTFTANTTAPGIPLNIDIADVSVKSTSSWKLAISWEEPTSGTVANYAIYRSTDGETYTLRATSGGISYVDVGLTQQTYYYKVKACDSTNNCGEFSEAVSLYPDGKYTTAAELVSDPVASDITTKKATISWTTARTADSRIAYGTSSGDYFDTEVSNSEQVTSHVLELPNLSPGTTYYFVTRWTDEDGNLGESEEQEFTTAPPPSTEEPTVTAVGLDNAIIQFVSRNASRIRIYYGETSAFGGLEDVVVGTSEGTHTVQLKELKDGTKYFFKINSFDSEGAEYEGEIHSFTTLPKPKLTNVKISQVKGTAKSTLLLTWTSNTEVSSIVTYYPLNAPSLAKDEINIALKTGRHQMILYDLAPQTTYGALIKGKDVAGNEASSELLQVTTSADTRPPMITDLKVDGEIIGTGDEATAQLIVSYKTDEPSTAQIEFGEGSGSTYSQKTQEDGALTNSHLVVISELSPAKVYHLRAISKDEFGNKAESVDKVVITPKATENALDLVITSMSSIFGFLQK